jgi:sRNA-binding carbon storage regulator CsrA
MLILLRKKDESIIVVQNKSEVIVTVAGFRKKGEERSVQLAIHAPNSQIFRQESYTERRADPTPGSASDPGLEELIQLWPRLSGATKQALLRQAKVALMPRG